MKKFLLIGLSLVMLASCGNDKTKIVEGKDGKDGRDGYSSIISSTSVSAPTCLMGGIKLDLFLDRNYNDQTDPSEFIVSLGTICNGLNGSDGAIGNTGPQGAQGDTGPQGPAGPIGPQGDQGIQGIQGVQGVAGPKGDQGLQGVQGIQGEQGIQGIVGADGPQGEPGLIGKSAYQVAVDNGYSGTVTQWLASLKGQDGEDGEDGQDGQNGLDGSTGGVVPVRLCAADNANFPEYGFVINGNIYAVYYGQVNGTLSAFLARLNAGSYVTTNDNTPCSFTVSYSGSNVLIDGQIVGGALNFGAQYRIDEYQNSNHSTLNATYYVKNVGLPSWSILDSSGVLTNSHGFTVNNNANDLGKGQCNVNNLSSVTATQVFDKCIVTKL